jgi:hypothetical protein
VTNDQSRRLKVGNRVCWKGDITDMGTITGNEWSGVVIEWDDGRTSSIHHNDMAGVERAPANLNVTRSA